MDEDVHFASIADLADVVASQSRVRKECGRIGQERGARNEARVLAAAWAIPDAWVLYARPATPEEDARGIDVVVGTDVGEVHIQVKSSGHGAHKARQKNQKYVDGRIRIVIADSRDDTMIARRTRNAVAESRAMWLAERRERAR